MKLVCMAVLSASILGLAACASTAEKTTGYVPAPKVQATTAVDDDLYMARVEAIARRRGIDLTWVNPPFKIVAKKDD
jgi:hypothetical protein